MAAKILKTIWDVINFTRRELKIRLINCFNKSLPGYLVIF